VLSTGSDKQLRVWALEDGACLKVLTPPVKPTVGAASDGSSSGGGGGDGGSSTAGADSSPVMDPWGVMHGCAAQGDGSLVAASGSEGTLCGWRTSDWSSIAVVKRPGDAAIQTCAFSSDGQQVLAGGDDQVRVPAAAAATGADAAAAAAAAAADPPPPLSLSPPSSPTSLTTKCAWLLLIVWILVPAMHSVTLQVLRVWSTAGTPTRTSGWHLVATLPGHAGGVLACVMVPAGVGRGSAAVSVSRDGTIRTWQPA
jgi:WD40 repeat protein